MMLRILAVLIAFLGLFWFPSSVNVALLLLAALAIPASGIALGMFADFLYYAPHAAFLPYWSLLGLFSFGIGLLLQRFLKTRIIGG